MQSAFETALSDLREFGCATAVLQATDLTTLHLAPTAPPDLGTLPQAAMTCHQYIRVKSGDLALVNDPSSGSFSLSTFTLVTAASLPDGDLLIAARFDSGRKLGTSGKADDEGVRIPPMPLAVKRVFNRDLMTAIGMHPLAPKDFAVRLEKTGELLWAAARKFEALAKVSHSGFDQAGFEDYLRDSGIAFETTVAKLPLGTAIVSGRVPGSNEQVKLTLELSEKHVEFDFKGTEPSVKVGVSEVTTFGTCVWSVLALLGEAVPLTSTVLGHFQVSAPTNTLLATRANVSLERGLSLVVPLVGELVHSALAKINPTLKRSGTAGTEAIAQLEFADGRWIALLSAPGTGAVSGQSGQDSFGAWNPGTEPLIEMYEQSLPLTFTAIGLSKGSGGKGLKRGGDAQLVAGRLREPAKLRWLLGRSTSRTEGQAGGKYGAPGQVEIVRADGKKESFTALEGVADLLAGDEVRIYASGGGGWGELESKNDSKTEAKNDAKSDSAKTAEAAKESKTDA